MGLKIYREINNNNSSNDDKDILLEFVCNVGLLNATDIFENCLHYDSDENDFADVSEVYYDRLNASLDYLMRKMERECSNNNSRPNNIWLQEAKRCYEILSNELNNRTDGYYMLFIR